MSNTNGWPVWYELMTPDAAAIAPFYKEAVGWTIPAEGMTMPNGADYRWIERADGKHEGGVLAFSPEMVEAGMQSGWVTYFYADDVDALIEKATSMGAMVHMPAQDMPGAGRMAMLSDPQGAMFYLIAPEPPEGEPEAQSDVFDEQKIGHAAWNELNTTGAEEQVAFYTSLFGWRISGEMPMPEGHICKFVECDGTGLGAICSMMPPDWKSAWMNYFRVEDINVSKAAVEKHGCPIIMGPHEVPGGDLIMVTVDPAGAPIGLCARKKD
jgi:predicted enzyme related to lactoylglutathione lyase